ncbi:MAG: ATP-binding protein [Candidatus Riflebacteria bacterium]|nr:ATP-binding protein [Candidatus Riflebacteria bacterium]
MTEQARWPVNRFSLTLPNTLDSLRVAQAFVRECGAPMGFEEAELTALEMVTEESVLNVLQHAYTRDDLLSFTVECVRHADQLELAFHDQGRPFDPGVLPAYPGVNAADLTAPAGLGRYLVARLMDRIEVRNLGAEGKQVRLFKRIGRQWQPPPEPPNFRAAVQALSPADFDRVEVRPMRPEEAVEVSRLIYDGYRYTYMTETPYNPEKLRALQAQGWLKPFVAVTPIGLVVAHVALMRSPGMPTIGEVGLAVTLPEARGHRLAQTVGSLALQCAVELGLRGVYANFVTAHSASQKVARRQAFGVPVGFFLARSPEGVSFKGIAEETPRRNSTLIMFHKLVDRPRVRVFAPERHRTVIEQTYRRCGLDVEIAGESASRLPAVPALVEVTVEKDRDIACFRILRAGDDLSKQMDQRLFTLRMTQVPVAFAMLDLFSPETPAVFGELEGLGFFFSGILPEGLAGADALIMTNLLSCVIDYDELAVVGEDARALLDYIRHQGSTRPPPRSEA